MANKNLTAAKNAKNDEFYTRIEDIQKELYNYPNTFVNKIVYLNCDDGEWSNFWRYFYQRFHSLKLKKLIATSYKKDGGTYKYEFEGNGTDYVNYIEGVTKTLLKGDGDFRSDECIEILKQVDIVVTNPPFSLFREYIAQLMKYEKKFLVIGPMNAVAYKEVFPFIKNNKIWKGYEYVKAFMQPDGTIKSFGNIHWFTNLEHSKRHHREEYYTIYSDIEYHIYDNYNAINIDKLKDIPCDWTGVMGVPITFLDKYCPEQFEIIGFPSAKDIPEGCVGMSEKFVKDYYDQGNTGCYNVGNRLLALYKYGKAIVPYNRILIRWKPEAMPKIINGIPKYNKENINGKQKSDRSEGGEE